MWNALTSCCCSERHNQKLKCTCSSWYCLISSIVNLMKLFLPRPGGLTQEEWRKYSVKMQENIFVFKSQWLLSSYRRPPSSFSGRENKNRKIRQAPGSVNKGWAKLWVWKCGRKRWFLCAYLLSKNTAMPSQKDCVPTEVSVPAPFK